MNTAPLCLAIFVLISAGYMSPASAEETAGWFPFTPKNTSEPGVIGMAGWLDAPAGKHGFVLIDGESLKFEDGTLVKFWGLNNGSGGCAPTKSEADVRAAWYSKFGVNAVRLHKFTNPCKDDHDSTLLKDDAWSRIDYYCTKLRDKGIYYGWSHIYHHGIRVGDKSKVKAYDELMKGTNGDTYGLVNFAPDLQDLHIQLTVNMLKHKNPFTGKTYAKDPALCFIELQNEDDIFFGRTFGNMKKCPTYKAMACEQFSDWLRDKYKSEEALKKAWGNDSFDVEPKVSTGESLAKRNILPICHPWWYSADGMKAKSYHQRLFDTARWMYETQNKFYDRFTKAIRDTGYRGPIVGSCWQAGEGYTHFYNLHSDFRAGIIDRHNYFGGGSHRLGSFKINNASMCSMPEGSIPILGTGMQQVKGAPFALSEWILKPPNEWTAEAPALIAVYGFGLQGWDGSYHFASKGVYGSAGENAYGAQERRGKSGVQLSNPHVYNADLPSQIGQYPILARMIYRGDIKEGEPISTRKVHISSLAEGKVGFAEKVEQAGDIKAFKSVTPNEALAVGKVQVEFTDEFQKSENPDLSKYIKNGVISSSTGELTWNPREGGYVTVNTPNTKGVIGSGGGVTHHLDDMVITIDTKYAILWVTSLEKEKSLADTGTALVMAIARHYNTGMQYDKGKTQLTRVGGPPLLMEPVKAKVRLGREPASITVLDLDGLETERTLKTNGKTFGFDTGKDKAIYYLIRF